MPDGPEVVVAASAAVATASTIFSSILSLSLFHFYRNLSNEYIT